MIKKIIPTLFRHFLITFWHQIKYQIKVGKSVYISDCFFENCCSIGNNSQITNCKIGKFTYITGGARVTMAKIGRYCSIGPNFRIGMGSHPSNTFVSTSPIFYSKNTTFDFSYVKYDKFQQHKFVDRKKQYFVEIGNDVWIGSNVTIMDGIKIGNGAIIGANSLVTENISPYGIYVGAPAKLKKYRFDKKKIKYLQDIKWWNKPEEWISKKAAYFDNINNFLKSIKLF